MPNLVLEILLPNYDCSFAGLLQLQMILKNCLFTYTLMLMVRRKSVPLALFWHYRFHWAQQFCFWERYLFYSLNVILLSQTGENTQGTVYIYIYIYIYILDVLCRQQIKLFQVVSTSEFHEYWWNNHEIIFLVPAAFCRASEARTQSRP